MADYKVNWYDDEVIVAMKDATVEGLLKAAFQIEATAKPRMRVDTGFNRNNSYVAGGGVNTFQAKSQNTKRGKRATVPTGQKPKDALEVITGFAANYAIYREIKDNALYSALVDVSQQMPGIIQSVGRGKFG